MDRDLDGGEIKDAAKALVRWFKSQDIDEPNSAGVCAVYLATMIGTRAPSRAEMYNGISVLMKDVLSMTEIVFSRK